MKWCVCVCVCVCVTVCVFACMCVRVYGDAVQHAAALRICTAQQLTRRRPARRRPCACPSWCSRPPRTSRWRFSTAAGCSAATTTPTGGCGLWLLCGRGWGWGAGDVVGDVGWEARGAKHLQRGGLRHWCVVSTACSAVCSYRALIRGNVDGVLHWLHTSQPVHNTRGGHTSQSVGTVGCGR